MTLTVVETSHPAQRTIHSEPRECALKAHFVVIYGVSRRKVKRQRLKADKIYLIAPQVLLNQHPHDSGLHAEKYTQRGEN